MAHQRDGGWSVRVMWCMPRGVEAHHGHTRLTYHRCHSCASVTPSTAHPRARLRSLRMASLDARVVAGWMTHQRDARWPRRAMCYMPRGMEAVHGHARLPYHRWTPAASVTPPTAHPRARLGMQLTASRCARAVGGHVRPQRDARRAARRTRCMPAGLEAHLGRARRACHRWTPAARAVASFTDARARTPRHATVEGRSMHVSVGEWMLLRHACRR